MKGISQNYMMIEYNLFWMKIDNAIFYLRWLDQSDFMYRSTSFKTGSN